MLLIKRKLDQTVVATSLNLKQEHSMLANGHKAKFAEDSL